MNRKVTKHSLVYISLLFCISLKAQDQDIETIRKQFAGYTHNTLTEKIFLHTDRNFYISGEIIWFKAFLVNGVSNQFSALSKVAYIDVLDDTNRPVLQSKIAISEGTGNGSFFLSPDFPTGNYKIRAYTNWMKNFDAAYYFEKQVTIVNTLVPLNPPEPDTSLVYDLRFFPEGGHLVKNVENTVAFKLTGKDGKGIQDFRGVVVNEENDTIALFSPYRFGIGHFSITPEGERYTAYITTASGERFSGVLPQGESTGHNMQLTQNKESITIRINSGNKANNHVYLFIHTRGEVKDAQRILLQNGKAEITIGKNVPGEGISHITLFDDEKKPVCERLYFRYPGQTLHIQANTDERSYGQRKKVTVSINTGSAGLQPVVANMSLSIYRKDSLQQAEPFDINSYLWLGSELRGQVEFPSWYFSSTSDSAVAAMDNLMLTHGWRRFNWKDIQQNKQPAFTYLPEINGHIVSGKITDSSSQRPRANTPVFLAFPGPFSKFYTAESDRNGNLLFFTRDVYGPGEIVLEADNSLNIPYAIDIYPPFSENYSGKKLTPLQLAPNLAAALQKNSMNAQIVRKFGDDRLKEFTYPAFIDSSRFYGKADEIYPLDNYTRFTTMEEVLREFVLGVLVGRSGKNYRLSIFDDQTKTLLRDNPLVLVDGVPVLDMNRIIEYDPLKVKTLEVIKKKYYYGPAIFYGIANFTTYKGNMETLRMSPRAVILDYDGLQMQREFYSPVYDTPEQQESRLADYRNLLFWNPDVITGKDGSARVSFYTSDLSGTYKAVLQGMSAEGRAGSYTFTFDVK
ncbi:MAG: hypothetical protein KIT80_11805 [Chitinophagaceae bacterium]|nr:hypothetical protein [Chitinophagaceae bacterium]MCW5927586.1 hypothetical protein [Chitinophagaceae bacterium]